MSGIHEYLKPKFEAGLTENGRLRMAKSELAAPTGSPAAEVQIPCPKGCDPRTAPNPNPRFCPVCNNTGWAKPGAMAGASDEVEVISRAVTMIRAEPAKDEDPYESEEYERFVASMVPHCHCRESNRPCDGVLAGGLCDNIQDEPENAEVTGASDASRAANG